MINKRNKIFFYLLFLIARSSLYAQVQNNPPMREVLGTSGGTIVIPASGNSIDYTIGESVIATVGPFNTKYLTQGFQQPNSANSALNETVNSINSSCKGANNGSVMFQTQTSTGNVTINWNNAGYGTATLFSNLAPGLYHYSVTDGNFILNDSITITEDPVDCGTQLFFYNGITPNGDNNNDTWVIDGITNFSENNVWIYNRWGDLVWSASNYDNVNIVWTGKNNNALELSDATYFYLVKAGGKVYKGWVELTH
jgi:gliding motility-associated-like protein